MSKVKETNKKKFPYQEFDSKGREIYYENKDGYWTRTKYDNKGRMIEKKDSLSETLFRNFDKKGNLISFGTPGGKNGRFNFDYENKTFKGQIISWGVDGSFVWDYNGTLHDNGKIFQQTAFVNNLEDSFIVFNKRGEEIYREAYGKILLDKRNINNNQIEELNKKYSAIVQNLMVSKELGFDKVNKSLDDLLNKNCSKK